MLPIAIAAAFSSLATSASCDGVPAGRPIFDATLLKPGSYTYEYRVKGKRMGRFVISIRRAGADHWLFVGDGDGQHWESVTTAEMRPVRATLQFLRAGRPYRMELTYGPTSVRYIETIDGVRGPSKEEAVPSWIVDQRVDWAAAMSAKLKPGQRISFAVFDPTIGVSTVRVTGGEATALPGLTKWGLLARADYRVCKSTGQEEYTLFSTPLLPSVLVREHLRDDEVDTLISMK